MSYQVFALKYRPQTFDEVVAQEAVTTTLKNAVRLKRLHHAYILTGPRGIGKTSLARLFSKALNCQKGPTPDPCNACPLCQDITRGRSLDVLEIDGASNTSVDDVRELRENIKYTPASGRYKIYIIDEVHMLSTSAFNALLKTLEEPPPHAIFIFATTEPQKLPATILSRVLRFDLRRIPAAKIMESLSSIAKKEGIKVDQEGLFLIAREAAGSLRDALSLMDQVVSFSGSAIKASQVREALGILSHDSVFEMTDLIFKRDARGAMDKIREIFEGGLDVKRWSGNLLNHFRHLLVSQIEPQGGQEVLQDFLPEEREKIMAQAKQGSWADLDRMFQILYRAYEEMARSTYPKTLLEITCLRLCHLESVQSIQEILQRLETLSSSPKPAVLPPLGPPSEISPVPSWLGFLAFVKSHKPQLASMLEHGSLVSMEHERLIISYPQGSIYYEVVQDPERMVVLVSLAQKFFKKEMKIEWILQEGSPPPDPAKMGRSHSIVDEALAIFDPQETRVVERKS